MNSLNIKHVDEYYILLIDGTAIEVPNRSQHQIVSDWKLLWSKDFYQKWSKALFDESFDEVFSDGDFNGQDDRAMYDGGENMEMVYKLTFLDGSILNIIFPDLVDSILEFDIEKAGNMASDFVEKSEANIYQWTTDDLDNFKTKRKTK